MNVQSRKVTLKELRARHDRQIKIHDAGPFCTYDTINMCQFGSCPYVHRDDRPKYPTLKEVDRLNKADRLRVRIFKNLVPKRSQHGDWKCILCGKIGFKIEFFDEISYTAHHKCKRLK